MPWLLEGMPLYAGKRCVESVVAVDSAAWGRHLGARRGDHREDRQQPAERRDSVIETRPASAGRGLARPAPEPV